MKLEINYSKVQLEEAVKYISKYNPSFMGADDYVRKSILKNIKEMACSGSTVTASMGWIIIADEISESIESDTNIVGFTISVDPAIGIALYDEDDYHVETVWVEDK